jgi:hypothetical protein
LSEVVRTRPSARAGSAWENGEVDFNLTMEKNRTRNILTAAYFLFLSMASVWIVVDGAAAEPYIEFRQADAFLQVGVSVGLMVLWLQFAAWLVYRVMACRLGKSWLVLTILVGVALFYLWHNPVGYVEDITKFVINKNS